jgi:hypothetical protein
MRKVWAAIAGLAMVCGLTPALANDSTAELAAGGLVLRHTANIEMRSEDLYISPGAVRVTYHFRNTSSAPITTVVAFPMPDITVQGEDDNISIPNAASANFLNFRTIVDSRPVSAHVELRVVSRGVDRTQYLQHLGVPLQPFSASTRRALDRLPQATRSELVRIGLAAISEYDQGHGMERHMQPTWTLRTTYFWTQTFAAGRDVVVQHRYTPATGSSAGTSFGRPPAAGDTWTTAWRRDACIDQDFLRNAARRGSDDGEIWSEQRIRYVLITGANWARPIGDFRMVIDKGAANNIVSFCGENVRRLSPTQFEVRYRNFTPRQDVAVVILHPTNYR